MQEWLIDARLALGQHHGALAEIRACIAADPLAEHPHVQLMLALYRSGQKAAALAAYTRLRDLTVREFGQDPGPEARTVLEQMLVDSPELMAPPRTLPADVVDGEGPLECRAGAALRHPGARRVRGTVRLCQASAARRARPG
jgi:DNA-binding SARP family transcriptional activator